MRLETTFLISITSYKVMADILSLFIPQSFMCKLIFQGKGILLSPDLQKSSIVRKSWRIPASKYLLVIPCFCPRPQSQEATGIRHSQKASPNTCQSASETPEEVKFWIEVIFICTKNVRISYVPLTYLACRSIRIITPFHSPVQQEFKHSWVLLLLQGWKTPTFCLKELMVNSSIIITTTTIIFLIETKELTSIHFFP